MRFLEKLQSQIPKARMEEFSLGEATNEADRQPGKAFQVYPRW